jgi:hypothetical protein
MSQPRPESHAEALIARVEASQTALEGSILEQTTLLRLFLDKIELLLESQAPKDGNGPTIQEILAHIALRLGEQTTILRKIDRHISGDTDHPAPGIPENSVPPGELTA